MLRDFKEKKRRRGRELLALAGVPAVELSALYVERLMVERGRREVGIKLLHYICNTYNIYIFIHM